MTRYYCPTSGDVEDDERGGFDVCCDRPNLHMGVVPVIDTAAKRRRISRMHQDYRNRRG